MAIRAIIWDMGGVILYMDSETPRLELARDHDLPLERIYAQVFDSDSAQLAMVGKITLREHWDNVGSHLGLATDKVQDFLKKFWSSDAIDLELVKLIHQLRLHYKTGVLSNAWDDLREIMTSVWKIAPAFDDIVISAEVGLAKPDPEIYKLAAQRLGVAPQEIVFIDDLARNIQAAEKVGFHSIRFISRSQVLGELQRILSAGEQRIPNSLQQEIEILRYSRDGRPLNPYDLVQLQIELEYQLDTEDQITPNPGSSEQARLIFYKTTNGVWPFFQRKVSLTSRQEIIRVGLERLFSAPGEFSTLLTGNSSYKRSGSYHTYYFQSPPSRAEFPEVCENDGQFEIIIDQTPVSRAWSVRENQYCAEIAVETIPEFRQRGFARQVTAAWGHSVVQQGRVAFFSHLAENEASQQLARSLGLVKFAETITYE